MCKETKLDRILKEQEPSVFDPNGSYTGIPKNKHDKPIQDADDL